MQISGKSISNVEQLRSQCLIVGVPAKGALRGAAKQLDRALGNLLSRLQKRGDIAGEWAQALMLPNVSGIGAERVLVVGTGAGKPVSDAEYRKLLQAVLGALAEHKVEDATCCSIRSTSRIATRSGRCCSWR